MLRIGILIHVSLSKALIDQSASRACFCNDSNLGIAAYQLVVLTILETSCLKLCLDQRTNDVPTADPKCMCGVCRTGGSLSLTGYLLYFRAHSILFAWRSTSETNQLSKYLHGVVLRDAQAYSFPAKSSKTEGHLPICFLLLMLRYQMTVSFSTLRSACISQDRAFHCIDALQHVICKADPLW